MAYMDLTKHYGIADNTIYIKCCFPVLSFYQIIDTVLVKESLKMTMAGAVSVPSGAPPTSVDMQR